ncbi:hypothetical protein EX30DRAFT_223209 [Ascodesmis nigricans]|uniref:Uncharacterized protein n=1 Tax=Ascodesmis nigricans TaxID=341454 RepID=A0A4S2MJI6_9PEZI|nr:hypothetical protein EX30DRAFT_223209 [Ascodesmis nigricans]
MATPSWRNLFDVSHCFAPRSSRQMGLDDRCHGYIWTIPPSVYCHHLCILHLGLIARTLWGVAGGIHVHFCGLLLPGVIVHRSPACPGSMCCLLVGSTPLVSTCRRASPSLSSPARDLTWSSAMARHGSMSRFKGRRSWRTTVCSSNDVPGRVRDGFGDGVMG